jgi:transcriptional regulator with XRE-family HTH domain
MAIAAHFEETPDGEKRQRDQRRRLLLDAEGKSVSGGAAAVSIHNLSATGLLIECEAKLEEGEAIAIDLPQAGRTLATVVWSSGRLHGCQFARPLGKAALSAAELQGADARAPFTPADAEPFPQRLQRLRAAKGMSLDRLANLLGVSKPTVWAWEQGRARPAPERIGKLAKVLEVEQSDLVPSLDTPAHRELLAQCRARIAEAFGIAPDDVRIMIEL